MARQEREGEKRVCSFESDLEEEIVDMRRKEERNSLRRRTQYDTHMHVYICTYICKPAHKNIVKLHINIIVIAYIPFRPEHKKRTPHTGCEHVKETSSINKRHICAHLLFLFEPYLVSYILLALASHSKRGARLSMSLLN